jgi:hypothetical protein
MTRTLTKGSTGELQGLRVPSGNCYSRSRARLLAARRTRIDGAIFRLFTHESDQPPRPLSTNLQLLPQSLRRYRPLVCFPMLGIHLPSLEATTRMLRRPMHQQFNRQQERDRRPARHEDRFPRQRGRGRHRVRSALKGEMTLMHIRRVGRDPCYDQTAQRPHPHIRIKRTPTGRTGFNALPGPRHRDLAPARPVAHLLHSEVATATPRVSKDPAQPQAPTGTNELSWRKRSVPFERSTRSW